MTVGGYDWHVETDLPAECEHPPHLSIIIDRHMQVNARRQQAGMARTARTSAIVRPPAKAWETKVCRPW